MTFYFLGLDTILKLKSSDSHLDSERTKHFGFQCFSSLKNTFWESEPENVDLYKWMCFFSLLTSPNLDQMSFYWCTKWRSLTCLCAVCVLLFYDSSFCDASDCFAWWEVSTCADVFFFFGCSSSKYVNVSIKLPIGAVEKAVGKHRHTQSGLLSATS